MAEEKVVYNNEIYNILHDYGNGQIEIKKENSSPSYPNVKLVKKEEVFIITKWLIKLNSVLIENREDATAPPFLIVLKDRLV